MASNKHFVTTTTAGAYPNFLQARIDQFQHDRVEESWHGQHILRGKKPTSSDILLMSNDYLAIANHPKIAQAQAQSLLQEGNGVLMSAIFLHGDNSQWALQRKFARYLGSETSILCQSGYAANVGLIQSIAGADIPVYLDLLAHRSLQEGVNSANAKLVLFRHNCATHLASQIERHGPGVIAVDSVYSTNGSIAPLEEIAEIAERTGSILIVDESHSLGTHGPQGKGLVAALGINKKVHFRTASLAKAFAARSGIITCDQSFFDYFCFESLPAIFSSALLPHEIAGLDATLSVIQEEEWRRTKLASNANYVREGLSKLGYNVRDSQSQIIALEAGTESDTIALRDALENHGIFGSVFCAPATSVTRAIVRFSIHAGLNKEDLDRILKACKQVSEELDVAHWPSTIRLNRIKSLASV